MNVNSLLLFIMEKKTLPQTHNFNVAAKPQYKYPGVSYLL